MALWGLCCDYRITIPQSHPLILTFFIAARFIDAGLLYKRNIPNKVQNVVTYLSFKYGHKIVKNKHHALHKEEEFISYMLISKIKVDNNKNTKYALGLTPQTLCGVRSLCYLARSTKVKKNNDDG